MLIKAYNNISDDNIARLGLSLGVAIFAHIVLLYGISHAQSQKTVSADILSLPTSVAVRFISPHKPVEKNVVKKVEVKKTKPVPQKIVKAQPIPQQLNNIEPAAAPPQVTPQVQKTVPVVAPVAIPVISDKALKGRRVAPQYPDRALRMRQEGTVWLHVLISETGARQDIKLHKPSQYALLNQAAIKAVKKWTFTPNAVGGRPTKSWVEIPIEFKIR